MEYMLISYTLINIGLICITASIVLAIKGWILLKEIEEELNQK